MTFTPRSLARFIALTAFVWLGLAAAPVSLRAVPADAAEQQRQLISLLQSEAPPADKAIACKKLAVYGNQEAVPALAALLSNRDLASWARIALEAIPHPSASQALRDAMPKLQGNLLIGVINSLGARRDAQSVEPLVSRLKDPDSEVAAASAAALGLIGGSTAAKALERHLTAAVPAVRNEVAAACVRCADQFLAKGNTADAIQLYDKVRQASVPKQRTLEATRGAILARGSRGIPILVEQLRSPDKALFGIGLRTARELPGAEVTKALAAELERASADRQALILMAVADRTDLAVLPILTKAAQAGAAQPRIVAVKALQHLGDASSVPALLAAAADSDPRLAQAGQASLARLQGENVNAALLARLPQATGKSREVLVTLAGQRGITEALPAVVQSATDADPGVRRAAVDALATIGGDAQVGDLVRLLQSNKESKDQDAIEQALLTLSARRGAGCVQYLLPLAENQDVGLRSMGLHALAGVGGPTALARVTAAIDDPDEAVQDEAVRIMSTWASNWPDDEGVADPLLRIAKSGRKPSHRILAMRGYLQYVQADKRLADDDKVAKIKETLALMSRPDEKRLAVAALGSVPSASSLALLQTFADEPELAEEAYSAILGIASRKDLNDTAKAARRGALELVAAKSKNDRTKGKAQEVLKGI